jgi:hypothetical protein
MPSRETPPASGPEFLAALPGGLNLDAGRSDAGLHCLLYG